MLMFVYGTLKKGYHNNRLMQGAKFLGTAFTVEKMVMTGYGVPFIWPKLDGDIVQGELYDIGDVETDAVAKARLAALDRLEGNGRTYQRRAQTVRLQSDNEQYDNVWIYEAMRHVRRSFDDPDVLHDLNSNGALEWEPRRMPARRA